MHIYMQVDVEVKSSQKERIHVWYWELSQIPMAHEEDAERL